jgi:hypothetical protein
MFDRMKIPMKFKISAIALLICIAGFATKSNAQEKFEKAAFYNVMSGNDVASIDDEITVVQNSSTKNKPGYYGALLMKKAGLISGASKKLKLFKQGRIELETALLNEPENTEYHFLRLAIEEHAPKIVKYHNDIEADKAIIKKNFKELSPAVQHAILDYCKKSNILHVEDFS